MNQLWLLTGLFVKSPAVRIKLWLFLILGLFLAVPTLAVPAGDDYSDIRRQIGELMALTPSLRLKYIQDRGVEIYVVPVLKSKAQNFAVLPVTPEKFARFAKSFEEGGIGGLYLTPSNASYQVTVPTILIAQDAEPWALIHEFVHALLDKNRSQQTDLNETKLVLNLEDAREDLNELWWAFKERKTIPPEAELMHLLASFIKVASLDAQILRVVQLEEILIEGLLRDAYFQHKPADFKKETYEYSAVYILSNAQKAKNQIQGVLDKCVDLMEVAVMEKSILAGKVLRTCVDAQSLLSEIQRQQDKALKVDSI